MSAPSVTSLVIIYLTTGLLAIGVLGHIITYSKALDLSGPNDQYERAKRITSYLETPAEVFTPEYKYTMLVLYAIFIDDLRKPGTVQVTQTWDPSLAAGYVAAGKHVYVFAELQSEAGQEFALDPVHTGTPVPELYLLGQEP